MIYLNYLLQIIFLLILFSVESILGTPIFSLFLIFKLLDRLNLRDEHSFYYLVMALLALSLAVALFYQLSVGVSLLIISLYYYLRTVTGSKIFSRSFQQWQLLQLLLFAALQLTIFFLSGLSINIFMLVQGLLVLILLISKSIAINKL